MYLYFQGTMRVDWTHGDRTGLISTYADNHWILAERGERSHLFAHLHLADGAILQTSPQLYMYESTTLQGMLYGVTEVKKFTSQTFRVENK